MMGTGWPFSIFAVLPVSSAPVASAEVATNNHRGWRPCLPCFFPQRGTIPHSCCAQLDSLRAAGKHPLDGIALERVFARADRVHVGTGPDGPPRERQIGAALSWMALTRLCSRGRCLCCRHLVVGEDSLGTVHFLIRCRQLHPVKIHFVQLEHRALLAKHSLGGVAPLSQSFHWTLNARRY
jgi:hypothetical protein